MQYTANYQSPFGNILLAADNLGLTGLWFEGQRYFALHLDEEHEEKGLENEIDDEHDPRFPADEDRRKYEDGDVEHEHENTHVHGHFAEFGFGEGSENGSDTRDAAGGEIVVVGKVVQGSGHEQRRQETDEDVEQNGARPEVVFVRFGKLGLSVRPVRLVCAGCFFRSVRLFVGAARRAVRSFGEFHIVIHGR